MHLKYVTWSSTTEKQIADTTDLLFSSGKAAQPLDHTKPKKLAADQPAQTSPTADVLQVSQKESSNIIGHSATAPIVLD